MDSRVRYVPGRCRLHGTRKTPTAASHNVESATRQPMPSDEPKPEPRPNPNPAPTTRSVACSELSNLTEDSRCTEPCTEYDVTNCERAELMNAKDAEWVLPAQRNPDRWSQAVCNDGSPFGFQVRLSPRPEVRDWPSCSVVRVCVMNRLLSDALQHKNADRTRRDACYGQKHCHFG